MFKFIGCFVFLLTHSVLAQASGLSGSVRLDTQKWVATYAGETEVDGLPVTVTMDIATHSLNVPEAMVGMDLLVPFQPATAERAFRLTFIVSHNPRIQSSYVIQPRTISMDGNPRFAYVSNLDDKRDFRFVVLTQDDANMLVSYTRKLADGSLTNGQIVLSPIPHILAK